MYTKSVIPRHTAAAADHAHGSRQEKVRALSRRTNLTRTKTSSRAAPAKIIANLSGGEGVHRRPTGVHVLRASGVSADARVRLVDPLLGYENLVVQLHASSHQRGTPPGRALADRADLRAGQHDHRGRPRARGPSGRHLAINR